MKTTILFALILIGLGSCTETVEVERLIHDTLYLDKPRQSIAPSFITLYDTIETVRIDTVEIHTVVTKTDTLIQIVTKDSLIIQTVEKIVEHRDTVVIHDVDTLVITLHDTTTVTVYQQRVVYLSTEYLFPGQSVFFIPEPLMPYYKSFITDAQARGKSPTGGDLIVQYVKSDELPGEGWVSGSVQMSGWQNVIYLDEGLLPEHSKAALYRELSRLELRKQYSKDVNKIMSNFFRTSPEPTTSEINTLFL